MSDPQQTTDEDPSQTARPSDDTEVQPDPLDAASDAAFAEGDDDLNVAAEPTRDEELERFRASSESAERRVLQAQAEAENFRKRLRRENEETLRYAAAPMVTELLQVRDNLHRAVEAAGNEAGTEGLRGGVEAVVKLFDDTLAKYGVKEIPAEGELFDPNFHEALSQMPSDTVAAGMVAMVAQPGFQMHDRVIRPTQVIVSTGPA